jgi:hypothetical protein
VLELADVVAPPTLPLRPPARWPCQEDATKLPEAALLALLNDAGRARFLEKAGAFRAAIERQQVTQAPPATSPAWLIESRLLFVALAEGMGFGREQRGVSGIGRAAGRCAGWQREAAASAASESD